MKKFELNKLGGLLLLILLNGQAHAQLTVSAGTQLISAPNTTVKLSIRGDISLPGSSASADFSNWNLTLIGGAPSSPQLVVTSGSVSIANLETNSPQDKSLRGEWNVGNLTLASGKIVVAPTGKLIYSNNTSSINEATVGNNSYVVGPLFVSAGSDPQFFPIGNAKGYFPVSLTGFSNPSTVLGIEAVDGDPGLAARIGADIKEVFTGHHWTLKVDKGTYTGASAIQLSLTDTEALFGQSVLDVGSPVILELNRGGDLKNLGGEQNTGKLLSQTATQGDAALYAIAKSDKVEVRINRFITPNNLDDKNNVLRIENIQFFPENTVTLIDRWGVPVKVWKNFVNYSTTDSKQGDFDFSTLSIGNYVCVVEYNDPKTNNKGKAAQMISVVK